MMEEEEEVRVLTLAYQKDESTKLLKVQQGDILMFKAGPTLMGRNIYLWTSYPVGEPGTGATTEFDKEKKYHQICWEKVHGECADVFARLKLNTSGAFHYYITEDGGERRGSGYFVVNPRLTIGHQDEVLPLDCIQCQSVLTKNLGTFDTWGSRLLVTKECGYNMIHFTPPQKLGKSDSCYCLADNLELDPRYGATWDDLHDFVKHMRDNWNVLSICDVVLNHAANESQWLHDHPECTYNCFNTKNLRPAFLFDQMFVQVTIDIASGKWVDFGVPKGVCNDQAHLDALRSIVRDRYMPEIKLEEFFMLDEDKVVADYLRRLDSYQPGPGVHGGEDKKMEIIQDPEYRRLQSSINFDLALELFGRNVEDFKRALRDVNFAAKTKAMDHLHSGLESVLRGAAYERLDPNGPKIVVCDEKHPLIRGYFLTAKGCNLVELEKMMYEEEGKQFMAHNGWAMNMDPTVNFTSVECDVYLRRELIAWGDSVKLNFGEKPSDSPFLWNYMKDYVEKTAKVFHGIRLDNCHSTPIHVAEYLLDCARRVRPNLYVIAELFTKSEHFDNIFLNRLGINSLIREALAAWDSHEQGRLIHRYGGDPVGAFIHPTHRPVIPSIANAIFFDQSHDNPTPAEKRTVLDALPSSALINMASCATGSNRGYDELVPNHIHVVKEQRVYPRLEVGGGNDEPLVNMDTGIMAAKKIMNDLHFYMGKNGFSQLYVDQMSPDVVGVTRHSTETHESVVTIASTCFHQGVNFSPLELNVEGKLVEIVYEASLEKVEGVPDFREDEMVINGLQNYKCTVKSNIPITESSLVRLKYASDIKTIVDLHNLKPGSAIAFKFRLPPSQHKACAILHDMLHSNKVLQELETICQMLDLNDLNKVLFRCDQEERDETGDGVYVLDGYIPPYSGFQGFMSLLSKIVPMNDLGNWLPNNLRAGDWLMDYIVQRLRKGTSNQGCINLAKWLEEEAFCHIKAIPRYLVPRYFEAIYSKVYNCLVNRVWEQMSTLVRDGSEFVKLLALGSVQHGAAVKSAPLPPLSPRLEIDGALVSLAAGLPHFSTGYMRNWGRDTFISLPGLFILTGRHQEARILILAYAGCLRHGLIPNLLDGGKNARFNCRDAFWWWLHCIKVYVENVPNGEKILQDPVSRLFPSDESAVPRPPGETEQPLEEVIHEGLQKHFGGLKFRELNAGTRIDAHMKNEGFDNEIGVDLETGFVYGGNVWNCGTWMDKMGSSDKAGNRGKPSTPRDGSAVELVGLSYACLNWLAEENRKGRYKNSTVTKDNGGEMIVSPLGEWAAKIKSSFEQHFYVTKGNNKDKHPELINKVNIYKDTLNAGHAYADYQLRCNFPIAMAVAPDLFDAHHAWEALQVAKEKLLGPLGMATLDPDDWAYRGNYDNSNDSTDPSIAHGANYHQGPEWLWPVGFFLRAYLIFAERSGGNERRRKVVGEVMAIMSSHYAHLLSSHWRGLPELTNGNGQHCRHSNPTQAWSFATLLEVIHYVESKSVAK